MLAMLKRLLDHDSFVIMRVTKTSRTKEASEVSHIFWNFVYD